MRIGEMLADRKFERGINEDELGELLGTSQASVNRWITGQNMPTRTYWPAIAKFLGITQREVADLIGREKRNRSPIGVEARLSSVEAELVHLGRKLVDFDRTIGQIVAQLDEVVAQLNQPGKKRR